MTGLFLPFTTGVATAAQYPAHGYGRGFWDGWGPMMPFGGMLFWIILLLVIFVVVMFVKRTGKSSESQNSTRETALDILKTRYAKGDLNKEEFERMKQDIRE